ncbi:hypothetical protein BGZ65_012261, partial [Modicella reniformis]
MTFRNTTSSSLHTTLSPQKALGLVNVYLENARKVKDPKLALELCSNAESSLSRIVEMALNPEAQLQDHLGSRKKAQSNYKNAEKLGWHAQNQSQQPIQPCTDPNNSLDSTHGQQPSAQDTSTAQQGLDIITVPHHIFSENKRPPTATVFNLPESDERLNTTQQLSRCLGLLQATISPDDIQDPTTRSWLQAIENDTDERERLASLATAVIREFTRDELKDTKAVAEVVTLAPILKREDFLILLRLFYDGIGQSDLLD